MSGQISPDSLWLLAALAAFSLGILLTGWLLTRQDHRLQRDLMLHPAQDHASLLATYIRRQRWQPLVISTLTGLLLLGFHVASLETRPSQPDPDATEFTEPAIEDYVFEDGAPADAVLDVFDPTPPPEDLENLKIRYENALVGVFLLHQCGHISREEVQQWERALRDHLARQPDTEALANQIFSAAYGSFELFYHRTPCDSPAIPVFLQQFNTFRAKLN